MNDKKRKLFIGLNELESHEDYNMKIIDYGNGNVDYVVYGYTINKRKKGVIKKEPIENKLKEKEHWLNGEDVHKRFQIISNDEMNEEKIANYEKKCRKEKAPSKDVMEEGAKYKEISKSNLLKSSRKLYQYAQSNTSEFTTFITLTFKENITDIEDANKKFDIWRTKFKLECKNNGYELKYLGVPEFQKRGAVHYHILTNIPMTSNMFIEQENKKGFDVKYWKYGFSSVFDLSKTDENFNVVKYIAKYFFKDMDNRFYGHNKLLKSNNLKKPKEEIYRVDEEFINQCSYMAKQEWLQCIGSYNNMMIFKDNNEMPF